MDEDNSDDDWKLWVEFQELVEKPDLTSEEVTRFVELMDLLGAD